MNVLRLVLSFDVKDVLGDIGVAVVCWGLPLDRDGCQVMGHFDRRCHASRNRYWCYFKALAGQRLSSPLVGGSHVIAVLLTASDCCVGVCELRSWQSLDEHPADVFLDAKLAVDLEARECLAAIEARLAPREANKGVIETDQGCIDRRCWFVNNQKGVLVRPFETFAYESCRLDSECVLGA